MLTGLSYYLATGTGKIVLAKLAEKKWHVVLTLLTMLIAVVPALFVPVIYRVLIDQAIPDRDMQLSVYCILGVVLIPLLGLAITYGHEYLRVWIGEHVSIGLRESVFEHVIRARVEDLQEIPTADLSYRINIESAKIGEMFIAQRVLPLAHSGINLLGILGMMLWMDYRLTTVAMFAVPVTFVITRKLTRKSEALDRPLSDHVERGNRFLQETFAGIKTVRSLSGESRERRFWQDWLRQHKTQKLKTVAFHHIVVAFPNEVINSVVIGLLFGVGAFGIMNGSMSIGTLVAFMAYVPRAYAALKGAFSVYVDLHRVKISFDKLNDVLKMRREETIADRPNAAFDIDRGAHIAFRNVSFGYNRGFAIRNMTFEIKEGEFIGIVGPSGGGKSTIFDLLLRFYEPDSGEIMLGELELSRLSPEYVRDHLCLIPQDPFLWNTTIGRNILYPQEPNNATYDVMTKASQQAQIHRDILGFPDQYETIVGENGHSLSGGERQRIAIARAFVRRPNVLLIDEGTASLDALTEASVKTALEQLRKGKTTLVIAHRLSTILDANRILVVGKNGELVEEGTVSQLIDQRGLFSEMYKAQYDERFFEIRGS